MTLDVPALVLAAGRGTRLHPLSCLRAKPALPVAGRPLIVRILEGLAVQGVSNIVVNLHHRPETITRELGDGAFLGLRVRYSWEPRILGSAGGPRRALSLVDAGCFLVVNGDTLVGLDVRALIEAHRRSGARVTMAVMANPNPAKYGGLLAREDGWVTGFTPAGSSPPAWHFVGVQAVDAAIFAGLTEGEPADSVSGLYPELIKAEPRAIRILEVGGPFRDIGTPADYLETCLALAQDEGLGELPAGSRARVAPTARVVRSALWDDVSVGPESELIECVVGDGVRLPACIRARRMSLVPAGACEPRPRDRREGDVLLSPLDP